MKEMEYKCITQDTEQQYEILDEGYYKDYHYVIVSYFRHPCAYIELPKNHQFYGKDWDKIPVDCHFGLTYSRNSLLKGTPDERQGYWVGWDYGHYTDYAPYYTEQETVNLNLHKWTTAEILQEIKEVIESLLPAKED